MSVKCCMKRLNLKRAAWSWRAPTERQLLPRTEADQVPAWLPPNTKLQEKSAEKMGLTALHPTRHKEQMPVTMRVGPTTTFLQENT
jgi:hypothetical protein